MKAEDASGRDRLQRQGLVLCLLLVMGAGLFLRLTLFHLQMPLANDEARYVGAMRDFLETGQFLETVTNRSLPRLTPLGLPLTVAAVAKVLGIHDVEAVARGVVIFFGALVPGLVFGLCYRVAGRLWPACAAGLLAACNAPLVRFSAEVMTESPYIVTLLLLTWGVFELFHGRLSRRPLAVCLAAGLAFVYLYLLRVSALYLLPALPLLLVILNRRRRVIPWRSLGWGIAVFLLVGTAGILANSYRLYLLNGYFGLSPQVAGNIAMGDVLGTEKGDLLKLDPTGSHTARRAIQDKNPGLLETFIRAPLERGRLFLINAVLNLRDLWVVSWGRWEWGPPHLLAGAWLLYLLAMLRSGRARRPRGEAPERLSGGMLMVFFLLASHFAAFSFIVNWSRYMVQATPLLLVLLALGAARVLDGAGEGGSARATETERVEFQWGGKAWRPEAGNGPDDLAPAHSPLRRGGVFALVTAGAMAALLLAELQETTQLFRRAQDAKQCGFTRQARLVEARARERGVTPHVVNDSSAVAYYARGYGYIVPYAEDDPGLLATYLGKHGINFVSTEPRAVFANLALSVHLYYLLLELNRAWPELVIRHQDCQRDLFEIMEPPRLEREGDFAPGSLGGAVLKPGERYLLTLEFQAREATGEENPGAVGSLILGGSPLPPSQVFFDSVRRPQDPLKSWLIQGTGGGTAREAPRLFKQFVALSQEGGELARLALNQAELRGRGLDLRQGTIFRLARGTAAEGGHVR